MSKPKKNQILQFVTPFVDRTDGLSIESGVTSGFTQRLWGVKHGVSTAATAKTPSKTLSVVRSGVFRVTLKSTEVSDFDQILWQGTHASCADQLWSFDLVDNDDSDVMSALTVIQSMASDAHSAATQANSRVLLVQSRLSDLDSRLVSDVSDILSALGNISVTLTASDISDIASAVVANLPGLNASDISDIASAVRAILVSDLSDIYSAAQQTNSRVLLTQSRVSDVQSFLSNMESDLLSLLTTTGVQLSASMLSDLRSAITAGGGGGVTASDISDIASAVRAVLVSDLSDIYSAAQQTNSRVLLNQSRISDVYSMLSDLQSDFQSRVPKAVATNSQLSDLASDLKSAIGNVSVTLTASDISDIASAVVANLPGLNASDISDIASAIDAALASRLSDILSAAQQTNSRVLLTQSRVSDVQSFLSNMESDLLSLLTTTGVQLNASTLSDLRSAITAGGGGAGVTASDISDIASAVRALLVSDLSDIYSAATQTNSRVLLTQSRVSDIQSFLSDMQSDLLSVLGTTGVQLNASTLSDLRSAITAGGGGGGTVTASDISDIASAVYALLASDLSDTLSAARQGVSRVLLVQSLVSDIQSYLVGMSGMLSDTYSAVSNLQSDFDSRFPATIPELTADPGATPTWAQAEAIQFMWLRNNSKTTSSKRFLRNSAGTTVLSATHGDDGTSYVQGKLG